MNVVRRLAETRRIFGEAGTDALLVNASANVRYLTGFDDVFDEEPASLALVTSSSALLFVDSRYHEAAEKAAHGSSWEVRGPERDVWEAALAAVEDAAADPGGVRLGVESSVQHRRFESLAGHFAGALVALDDVAERVRVVKEDEEVDRISRAARIADAAFEHVVGLIEPGLTEVEVALALEVHMRERGSEGVAFPPIVAAGAASSKPHARPTSRKIRSGELVVLDFGARVGGYCSDMTRTIVVGRASAEQRSLYSAVLRANEAGLAAVRSGVSGADADAAARSVLEGEGLAERFGHGLGHGVGLEVHESPRLGPRSDDELRTGSVVTVEPGVYVPEFGGVRIEDLVVVTEDGARVLTHSTKDLVEL